MRLKLDENLGRTAASLFQSAWHDTQTVRGQGLSKATDREVIAACRLEQPAPTFVGGSRPNDISHSRHVALLQVHLEHGDVGGGDAADAGGLA